MRFCPFELAGMCTVDIAFTIYASPATVTSVIGANRSSWRIQLRGILNVKCCATSTAGRAYDLCVSCTCTLREYAKLQSLLSNPRLIIMQACEIIANSRDDFVRRV